MAIVAPYSKYRKGNLKIFIGVLIAAAIWFAYDGYVNKNFIEKHTIQKVDKNNMPVMDEQGQPIMVPDSDLKINRALPPFLALGALILGGVLLMVKNKKIVLEDNILKAYNKEIDVDKIQKIDKTNFQSKGKFTITYKNSQDQEVDLDFSAKAYDNLKSILDELVNKLT